MLTWHHHAQSMKKHHTHMHKNAGGQHAADQGVKSCVIIASLRPWAADCQLCPSCPRLPFCAWAQQAK